MEILNKSLNLIFLYFIVISTMLHMDKKGRFTIFKNLFLIMTLKLTYELNDLEFNLASNTRSHPYIQLVIYFSGARFQFGTILTTANSVT